ncbi:MAG: COG4315 family predicted lipoprotein [Candidatus Limnocylindria bacterium]
MVRTALLLSCCLLALASCGDEDSSEPSAPAGEATATQPETAPKAEPDAKPKDAGKGTTIDIGDSEFGSMLFDSRKQAIYVFEKDPQGQTVCYGDCAEAWPPVYTRGEPKPGDGVRDALLGTVKRRDGRLQVTYAGKPLYFYEHEGPGEVRCHNVRLNGGLWWVVGPDGKRRP